MFSSLGDTRARNGRVYSQAQQSGQKRGAGRGGWGQGGHLPAAAEPWGVGGVARSHPGREPVPAADRGSLAGMSK